MKKRTAVSSILFVFALQLIPGMVAAPQSPPAPEHNGSSWETLSADARLWFVVGYNAGYNSGFKDGRQFALSSKPGTDDKQTPPQTAMYNLLLHNAQRIAASTHPSNGEIISEMAQFYKDFRNTPVCWGEAEQIAELALLGGAPSELDLDALRSEDAKDGCQ